MEFNAIDIDGDGRVDKQEMNIFLANKGIDEDHRQEIVDELFNKCDQDLSGKIEIDEFVA
jgi:Ca2+-binding EF-hand superfamily protein